MNRRILKKLSKRASPILRQLGDDRVHAPTSDDYLGDSWACCGMERKSLNRFRGKPSMFGEYDPLNGTIATLGRTDLDGEASDQAAWFSLQGLVRSRFTDWSSLGTRSPQLMCKLNNPAAIFRGAKKLLARQASPASSTASS